MTFSVGMCTEATELLSYY